MTLISYNYRCLTYKYSYFKGTFLKRIKNNIDVLSNSIYYYITSDLLSMWYTRYRIVI